MASEPLYRSVNTQTHGVRHHVGGDYRAGRPTSTTSDVEPIRSPMHGKARRGRDYTPLFRFLLSRVGQTWDTVFSEAKARLDRTDPIFWLVARLDTERQEVVRVGESTHFSGLYVDAEGLLQLVNPDLRSEDMIPTCTCCTHTFNGVRFGQVAPTRVPHSQPRGSAA
jgi:hypothetical protein